MAPSNASFGDGVAASSRMSAGTSAVVMPRLSRRSAARATRRSVQPTKRQPLWNEPSGISRDQATTNGRPMWDRSGSTVSRSPERPMESRCPVRRRNPPSPMSTSSCRTGNAEGPSQCTATSAGNATRGELRRSRKVRRGPASCLDRWRRSSGGATRGWVGECMGDWMDEWGMEFSLGSTPCALAAAPCAGNLTSTQSRGVHPPLPDSCRVIPIHRGVWFSRP